MLSIRSWAKHRRKNIGEKKKKKQSFSESQSAAKVGGISHARSESLHGKHESSFHSRFLACWTEAVVGDSLGMRLFTYAVFNRDKRVPLPRVRVCRAPQPDIFFKVSLKARRFLLDEAPNDFHCYTQHFWHSTVRKEKGFPFCRANKKCSKNVHASVRQRHYNFEEATWKTGASGYTAAGQSACQKHFLRATCLWMRHSYHQHYSFFYIFCHSQKSSENFL